MSKLTVFLVVFSWMSSVGFSQVKPADKKKPDSPPDYQRAVALADSKTDSALYYFDRYRNQAPETDSLVLKRSIIFYNYTGAVYLNEYFTDSTRSRQNFKKALTLLEKVIDMDSMNLNANSNLMLAHYNSGVRNIILGDYCKQRSLIENTDWNKPDSEIPTLAKLLECIKPEEYEKYRITPPFKAALPFALRMYRREPDNKKALEALQGIYMALSDTKQSDVYKTKLEKLSGKK